MKAFAEYVMRSRYRALLVTLVGAGSLIFCWISAAVVALVTLRKGVGAGAWLLLWGSLPAGAIMLVYGDAGPLGLLLGAAALAWVLRESVSLSLTVLLSVVVGLLTAFALMLFAGPMLDQIVQVFGQFLTSMEQQLAVEGSEPVRLSRPTTVQVAGMLGGGNAVMSVACLLLARYWQAELYNPGGFGDEFRALSLPPLVATGLAVAGVSLALVASDYRSWGMIFAVPLTFSGLALVHARARWRGQGTGWLTGFYLAWLFFDLVKLLVVIFAVADSWMRFRQQWLGTAGKDGDEDRD